MKILICVFDSNSLEVDALGRKRSGRNVALQRLEMRSQVLDASMDFVENQRLIVGLNGHMRRIVRVWNVETCVCVLKAS